ncbi:MAG: transcriptional repressor [Eubacteriales bacterium]|nr:transcriptional repressor [Eubacteriales bacterium]
MDIKRKTSVKRQAIIDALMAVKTHPSAEMLYEQLKPSIPDLSLGTVYRNLSIFTQEGSAQVVAHVNGKERFDGRTDAHAHFVCRKCGRVCDLDSLPVYENLYPEITENYHFVPESYSLTFTGLCSGCDPEQ